MDFIFGLITLFGTIILGIGAVLQWVHIESIPFFIEPITTITFYHIFGIVPQIIGAFWFALTE